MSGEEKKKDTLIIPAQATHFHEDPQCHQFREQKIGRYPMKGVCLFSQSPGWFMIPSIEEYREYCTTSRFGTCCWYRGAEEMCGTAERQGGSVTVHANSWLPPRAFPPTRGDVD